MFDQYPKFFHYLGERGSEIQTLLGSAAPELAKVLRQYPNIVRPSERAADLYRQYLEGFCHFGVSQPGLAKLFEDYFDPEVILWARGAAKPITFTELNKLDLSMQKIALIKVGRIEAFQLAEYLESAVEPVNVQHGAGATADDDFDVAHLITGGDEVNFASGAEISPVQNTGFEVFGSESSVGGTTPSSSTTPQTRTTRRRSIAKSAKAAPGTTVAPDDTPDREFFVTAYDLAVGGVGIGTGPPIHPLRPKQSYVLRMGVSRPPRSNLAVGKVSVGDIPEEGLKTHWVVISRNVIFVPESSTCSVRRVSGLWEANFDLFVPAKGDSKFHGLGITTGATPGELQITIFAVRNADERELYRELTVDLSGRELVRNDDTVAAPAHTLLRTSHEWTTPPVHVQVRFWKESALISMVRGAAIKDYTDTEDWSATPTRIGILIDNVRAALDALREASSDYFNAIDATDMAARLPSHQGVLFGEKTDGWQPLPNTADATHIASFDAMQASQEWFDLASAGYALYDACFDEGTRLRAMLDELKPGSRVDFQWTENYGAGWVPHVPWHLMYMRIPDVTRAQPIDPEAFLGLRYRLGSQAWTTQNPSRALTGANPTNSMNILYWGGKVGDEVAAEAQWQSAEFARWGQTQVPQSGQPDLKRQVVAAIDTPVPAPVGVVYLYCHCSVGAGDKVILRFGDTSKPQDVVTQNDLSFRKLNDGPLIFANACTTAAADPFKTGLLESLFFKRGVRAFVGTETKVPVQLASKFAWLYFQFFYRRFDPAPMAAGEAMVQARMFLWTQYRNVGGLFYSFVNQYDLYLASHEEVVALRQ